ncbi:hypothetical protein KIPB_002335, partial [Kipferlia bialata]
DLDAKFPGIPFLTGEALGRVQSDVTRLEAYAAHQTSAIETETDRERERGVEGQSIVPYMRMRLGLCTHVLASIQAKVKHIRTKLSRNAQFLGIQPSLTGKSSPLPLLSEGERRGLREMLSGVASVILSAVEIGRFVRSELDSKAGPMYLPRPLESEGEGEGERGAYRGAASPTVTSRDTPTPTPTPTHPLRMYTSAPLPPSVVIGAVPEGARLRGVEGGRVLVTGGRGSGKTTQLAALCASCDTPTFWVNAPVDTGAPLSGAREAQWDVILRQLCVDVLLATHTSDMDKALEMLKGVFNADTDPTCLGPSPPTSPSAICGVIQDALAQWEGDCTLVVEDVVRSDVSVLSLLSHSFGTHRVYASLSHSVSVGEAEAEVFPCYVTVPVSTLDGEQRARLVETYGGPPSLSKSMPDSTPGALALACVTQGDEASLPPGVPSILSLLSSLSPLGASVSVTQCMHVCLALLAKRGPRDRHHPVTELQATLMDIETLMSPDPSLPSPSVHQDDMGYRPREALSLSLAPMVSVRSVSSPFALSLSLSSAPSVSMARQCMTVNGLAREIVAQTVGEEESTRHSTLCHTILTGCQYMAQAAGCIVESAPTVTSVLCTLHTAQAVHTGCSKFLRPPASSASVSHPVLSPVVALPWPSAMDIVPFTRHSVTPEGVCLPSLEVCGPTLYRNTLSLVLMREVERQRAVENTWKSRMPPLSTPPPLPLPLPDSGVTLPMHHMHTAVYAGLEIANSLLDPTRPPSVTLLQTLVELGYAHLSVCLSHTSDETGSDMHKTSLCLASCAMSVCMRVLEMDTANRTLPFPSKADKDTSSSNTVGRARNVQRAVRERSVEIRYGMGLCLMLQHPGTVSPKLAEIMHRCHKDMDSKGGASLKAQPFKLAGLQRTVLDMLMHSVLDMGPAPCTPRADMDAALSALRRLYAVHSLAQSEAEGEAGAVHAPRHSPLLLEHLSPVSEDGEEGEETDPLAERCDALRTLAQTAVTVNVTLSHTHPDQPCIVHGVAHGLASDITAKCILSLRAGVRSPETTRDVSRVLHFGDVIRRCASSIGETGLSAPSLPSLTLSLSSDMLQTALERGMIPVDLKSEVLGLRMLSCILSPSVPGCASIMGSVAQASVEGCASVMGSVAQASVEDTTPCPTLGDSLVIDTPLDLGRHLSQCMGTTTSAPSRLSRPDGMSLVSALTHVHIPEGDLQALCAMLERSDPRVAVSLCLSHLPSDRETEAEAEGESACIRALSSALDRCREGGYAMLGHSLLTMSSEPILVRHPSILCKGALIASHPVPRCLLAHAAAHLSLSLSCSAALEAQTQAGGDTASHMTLLTPSPSLHPLLGCVSAQYSNTLTDKTRGIKALCPPLCTLSQRQWAEVYAPHTVSSPETARTPSLSLSLALPSPDSASGLSATGGEGEGEECGVNKWLDDAEVDICPWCNAVFGMTNRRHHCRACGGIFCQACSAHRVTGETSLQLVTPTGIMGEKERVKGGHRVCDRCYKEHKRHQ